MNSDSSDITFKTFIDNAQTSYADAITQEIINEYKHMFFCLDRYQEQTLVKWITDNSNAFDELIVQKNHTFNGCTAIHIASQNGNKQIVELLIGKYSIDVNLVDNDGNTSLRYASSNGHNNVVTLLINAGANVNLVNKESDTPLHWASRNGHTETVILLINANANVNFANKDGNTPLHYALRDEHTEIIKLLICAGANVTTVNNNDINPLHLAIRSKCMEIVTLLIDACVNINHYDWRLNTPLHWVLMYNERNESNERYEIIRQLISVGANVNFINRYNITPLYLAIRDGNKEIVNLMINASADINHYDGKLNTLLHWVSRNGYTDFVTQLISAGANINLVNNKGYTPLHIASYNGYNKIVTLLIEAGADINIANNYGDTPLISTLRRNNQGIYTLLINAGAVDNYANVKKYMFDTYLQETENLPNDITVYSRPMYTKIKTFEYNAYAIVTLKLPVTADCNIGHCGGIDPITDIKYYASVMYVENIEYFGMYCKNNTSFIPRLNGANYVVGEMVYFDKYNPNPYGSNICGHNQNIHFYMDRLSAERYIL